MYSKNRDVFRALYPINIGFQPVLLDGFRGGNRHHEGNNALKYKCLCIIRKPVLVFEAKKCDLVCY